MLIKSHFYPGEEWMYIKIYSNRFNCHNILIPKIGKLTNYLMENSYIDKWFYIFFSEPESSIRLRYHLIYESFFEKVLKLFNGTIKNDIENSVIYRYVIDTYHRELDRYGHQDILFAEDVFFIDSCCSIDFLSKRHLYNGNANLLWIYTLQNVHNYILTFLDNDNKRLEFVNRMNDTFLKEFYPNKNNLIKLNKKYREANEIMKTVGYTQNFKEIFSIIQKRNKNMNIIIDNFQKNNSKTIENKLSDFIHMSIIRIFHNNRFYEMITYNFLTRLYQSHVSRYGELKQSLFEIE